MSGAGGQVKKNVLIVIGATIIQNYIMINAVSLILYLSNCL